MNILSKHSQGHRTSGFWSKVASSVPQVSVLGHVSLVTASVCVGGSVCVCMYLCIFLCISVGVGWLGSFDFLFLIFFVVFNLCEVLCAALCMKSAIQIKIDWILFECPI